MSFEGKTLAENGLKIYDSENIWTPGLRLPHPWTIYMYITIISKDLLSWSATQGSILRIFHFKRRTINITTTAIYMFRLAKNKNVKMFG